MKFRIICLKATEVFLVRIKNCKSVMYSPCLSSGATSYFHLVSMMHSLRFCRPEPLGAGPQISITRSTIFLPSTAPGSFSSSSLMTSNSPFTRGSSSSAEVDTGSSNFELIMLAMVSLGSRPMSPIFWSSQLICICLIRQATTIPSVVRPRPAWQENTHWVEAGSVFRAETGRGQNNENDRTK